MDEETKKLFANKGRFKPCPNCGMMIEKNEGCDYMMCGTTSHGSLAKAIANGGCGYMFSWNTGKPIKTNYTHDININ